jgi:hypothetical protein
MYRVEKRVGKQDWEFEAVVGGTKKLMEFSARVKWFVVQQLNLYDWKLEVWDR